MDDKAMVSHQSVLNQFRGAYLGAVLGDVLASGDLPVKQNTGLPLGAIALLHTKVLTRQDPDLNGVVSWIGRSLWSDMAIQLALGLPGAIFFHDDLRGLQRYLVAQRQQWCPRLAAETDDLGQAMDDGIMTLAIVFSGILQQCFQPKSAIATIREMLASVGRSPGSMDHYLSCIEELLAERQPLAIAGVMLQRTGEPDALAEPALLTVAIALYAALSSLEYSALALQRIPMMPLITGQNDSKPILVDFRRLSGLIIGMIVGAYNGLEGIPLAWRYSLTPAADHSNQGVPQGYLEAYWNVISEVDVLQLVDQLFARWSGADPSGYFYTSMPTLAIISPPTYGRLRHGYTRA